MDIRTCLLSRIAIWWPIGMVSWYSGHRFTPYATAIVDSFHVDHDKSRSHTARLVEKMLETETVEDMKWPTCFFWLKSDPVCLRRIASRSLPPLFDRNLEMVLFEEWDRIPRARPPDCYHINGRPVYDVNYWLKQNIQCYTATKAVSVGNRIKSIKLKQDLIDDFFAFSWKTSI